MNKQLQNLNQNQIISGVTFFSTAALSVYTIKSNIEINKRFDEIYEDLNKIKQFVSENQRKNNINTVALGKKLEDVQNKFFKMPRQERIVQEEPKLVVLEEDEIDTAVNNFLSN